LSGSPFYARIKADVMAVAWLIPEGRVVTYGDVGAHLDVVPRHIAYILARLEPPASDAFSCHRVVGKDGVVRDAAQRAALESDGVIISASGAIADFEVARITLTEIQGMIPPQVRPPDAPVSKPRTRRA
jgi:methylated-DNA-protein-cysteine methyltransferase related protein